MQLRTKVIAVAIVTVFLASVGAVGVVSAQVTKTPKYDTTLIIMGYGQVTQPGKPIEVFGQLFSGSSGLAGMTVKVYTQRLGTTSVFGHEIGRPSRPELVATVNDWGLGTTQKTLVSFKERGDYCVYATFDGATGADSNYYRPSQSAKVAVKVTNTPTSLLMRKPTLTFATTSADHQVAFVGDSFRVGGQLRSFAPDWASSPTSDKTLSLYYQYKRPGSDTWGTPVLIGTSVYEYGGYGLEYKLTQPGYYRFQAKFAGDPVWKRGGYDASASNYVDVLVKTATPEETTQLNLAVSKTTPYTGEAVTFGGVLQTTASPPVQIPNANVYLQLSKDNVNWSWAPGSGYQGDFSALTGNNGAYTISGYFATPGVYYVRTVFTGTSEYSQAYTSSVKVTVSLPPINPPS